MTVELQVVQNFHEEEEIVTITLSIIAVKDKNEGKTMELKQNIKGHSLKPHLGCSSQFSKRSIFEIHPQTFCKFVKEFEDQEDFDIICFISQVFSNTFMQMKQNLDLLQIEEKVSF